MALTGPTFNLPAPFFTYGQQQQQPRQRPANPTDAYIDQRMTTMQMMPRMGMRQRGAGLSGTSVSDAVSDITGRNTAVDPSLAGSLKMAMAVPGLGPMGMINLARMAANAQQGPQISGPMMDAISAYAAQATNPGQARARANQALAAVREALAMQTSASANAATAGFGTLSGYGINPTTTEQRNALYGNWSPNIGGGARSPSAPSGSGLGHGMGIGSGAKAAGPMSGGTAGRGPAGPGSPSGGRDNDASTGWQQGGALGALRGRRNPRDLSGAYRRLAMSRRPGQRYVP